MREDNKIILSVFELGTVFGRCSALAIRCCFDVFDISSLRSFMQSDSFSDCSGLEETEIEQAIKALEKMASNEWVRKFYEAEDNFKKTSNEPFKDYLEGTIEYIQNPLRFEDGIKLKGVKKK